MVHITPYLFLHSSLLSHTYIFLATFHMYNRDIKFHKYKHDKFPLRVQSNCSLNLKWWYIHIQLNHRCHFSYININPILIIRRKKLASNINWMSSNTVVHVCKQCSELFHQYNIFKIIVSSLNYRKKM